MIPALQLCTAPTRSGAQPRIFKRGVLKSFSRWRLEDLEFQDLLHVIFLKSIIFLKSKVSMVQCDLLNTTDIIIACCCFCNLYSDPNIYPIHLEAIRVHGQVFIYCALKYILINSSQAFFLPLYHTREHQIQMVLKLPS